MCMLKYAASDLLKFEHASKEFKIFWRCSTYSKQLPCASTFSLCVSAKNLIGTARTFSNALCFANPWKRWNSFTRPGNAKFYAIQSMSHWKKGTACAEPNCRTICGSGRPCTPEAPLKSIVILSLLSFLSLPSRRVCSFCSSDFFSLGSLPCCTHILSTRPCCLWKG